MKKEALIGASVVLVLIAWLFRWDATAPNQYGSYTKVDRWIGTVYYCSLVGGCS